MFSTQELASICLEVNAIAIQAGRRIKTYFDSEYEIIIKEDKSPVTTADIEASEYITQALKKLTPDLPVLSEESADFEYAERKEWTTFWLIDPLDGTRQFIKKKPGFTVNISLVHQHQSILGVIYLPIGNSLYFASQDNGAFKQDDSSNIIPIAAAKKAGQLVRVCASSSHAGKSLQHFLTQLDNYELISIGSSIKSCRVAEGSADIYPRFGPTWEWDTAAAQCIVEQAGGRLTNLNFEPLTYNKESLLNPSFLAFGDQSINWHSYLQQS